MLCRAVITFQLQDLFEAPIEACLPQITVEVLHKTEDTAWEVKARKDSCTTQQKIPCYTPFLKGLSIESHVHHLIGLPLKVQGLEVKRALFKSGERFSRRFRKLK